MKILVFPRDTADPYQDLLYSHLPASVTVAYLPMVTPSQTVDLALIPALLVLYRLRGYRILHLHWLYPFAPAWASAVPGGRRLMQAWYRSCLAVARASGLRIVWTAHNLLPHARVFADDLAARRVLARSAAAVIAHNRASVPVLASLGAARVAFVPFGRFGEDYPKEVGRSEARRRLGIDPGGRVVAFVGSIERYKGVDLLLTAARDLEPGLGLTIVVAGRCTDPSLRDEVVALAGDLGERARVHLGRIPSEELQTYFASADAVALPFRSITNSTSLLLALEFGRPVVIPSLPELGEVPEEAAIRYEANDLPALAKALAEAARTDDATLASMGRAAKRYAAGLSWEASAQATLALYQSLLAGSSGKAADAHAS